MAESVVSQVNPRKQTVKSFTRLPDMLHLNIPHYKENSQQLLKWLYITIFFMNQVLRAKKTIK